MSTKDQAWAERVGREAVGLGMPCGQGLKAASVSRRGFIGKPRITDSSKKWLDYIPDFRDSLTELASIAWVEDVAREVYGERFEALRPIIRDGATIMSVSYFKTNGAPVTLSFRVCPTLAEACAAAVRAMKGGE